MTRVRAFNCDNMEFMKTIPDKFYELAIVDPPYFDGPNKLGYYEANTSSIGVKREGYKKIGTWKLPDKSYFDELQRISENQIIWGCNYYAGFIPNVGRIIWDKCNGDSSFSDAELASCSFHDSVRMFRFMWNGMMQGKSAAEGHIQQGNKKLNQKRIHPTEKPIEVYKWLLKNYAKPGDKIFDSHGGSLSIAIACAEMGHDLDVCELDKDYFHDSVKRLKNHCSQMNAFVERPEIEVYEKLPDAFEITV